MARPRSEFHAVLVQLMAGRGKVYFAPASNVTIEFPCLVYERDRPAQEYADNRPWFRKTAYRVTVISQDADSDILNDVADLPTSRFERHFRTDNLHHDVYMIHF